MFYKKNKSPKIPKIVTTSIFDYSTTFVVSPNPLSPNPLSYNMSFFNIMDPTDDYMVFWLRVVNDDGVTYRKKMMLLDIEKDNFGNIIKFKLIEPTYPNPDDKTIWLSKSEIKSREITSVWNRPLVGPVPKMRNPAKTSG